MHLTYVIFNLNEEIDQFPIQEKNQWASQEKKEKKESMNGQKWKQKIWVKYILCMSWI